MMLSAKFMKFDSIEITQILQPNNQLCERPHASLTNATIMTLATTANRYH